MNPFRNFGLYRGTPERWAVLSGCNRYRYALGRAWNKGLPIFSIVMLNPSTADETVDDATIRKCLHFARQEGCGSLVVRNLFALRATDPREIVKVDDPVGPMNLRVLETKLFFAIRVAAWGQLGTRRLRLLANMSIASAATGGSRVLALTEHGWDRSSHYADRATRQPRHPLYLPNAARVKPWPTIEEPS